MATGKRTTQSNNGLTAPQKAYNDFFDGVEPVDSLHEYTVKRGRFKGKTVRFKAYLPGDLLATQRQFLTAKLTELGYKSDKVWGDEYSEFVNSLPTEEATQIVPNQNREIIVDAAVEPPFSMERPENCPDYHVSVHELSPQDLEDFVAAIMEASGILEAEDRFRKADTERTLAGNAGEPV